MLIVCYNPLKREIVRQNERKKITIYDLSCMRSSNDRLYERS